MAKTQPAIWMCFVSWMINQKKENGLAFAASISRSAVSCGFQEETPVSSVNHAFDQRIHAHGTSEENAHAHTTRSQCDRHSNAGDSSQKVRAQSTSRCHTHTLGRAPRRPVEDARRAP